MTDMNQEVVRVGDLVLDLNSGEVQTPTRSTQLTPTETDLLGFLMLHSPRVYSQRALCFEFWPMPPKGGTTMVRMYAMRLRRKIEDDPAKPTRLVTRKGFGYRIVAAKEVATEGEDARLTARKAGVLLGQTASALGIGQVDPG